MNVFAIVTVGKLTLYLVNLLIYPKDLLECQFDPWRGVQSLSHGQVDHSLVLVSNHLEMQFR